MPLPSFCISAPPGRGGGEPPAPSFLNRVSTGRGLGRGLGRGHRRGSAALPNAPKRRVVAARRASSRGMRDVGRTACVTRQARAPEGFFPHILRWKFQLKVHTNSNRKKSKFSAQQKQYSFSDLCGGRNHLKRRGFLPPPPPTSLAVRRNLFSELSPAARGNLLRVSPRPASCISTPPGGVRENPPRAQLPEPRQAREGYGVRLRLRTQTHAAGVYPAALPNAPKRRVVAARRASKPWSRGCGGSRLRYATGTNV